MITKTNIKSQLKKELVAIEHYEVRHRSMQARMGALLLVGATLFHLSGVDHGQVQLSQSEISAKLIAKLNYTDKNETVRHPVMFDDGLRVIATTGA